MTSKPNDKSRDRGPGVKGNRWLLPSVVGLGAGLLAGFGIGRTTAPVPPPPADPPSVEEIQEGVRPVRGPDDAEVTVVEFTDYQCPFCASWHEEVYPELMERYGDRIRYSVRHFPLRTIHPFAQQMARGAVCAHRQGRFWEFHDLLFEDQEGGLGPALLDRHATALGLDLQRFRSCLDSESSLDVVSGDFLHGVELGVRSTPSFWIEGQLLRGSQKLEALQEVLDPALGATSEEGGGGPD